ncbi:MAG: serine acetyltransferase [Elusimicrobiota bacterium]|jgi:serine O-acetyltransferase|nr:serine acetyltransferase [Elusimicrobiota bacterium]
MNYNLDYIINNCPLGEYRKENTSWPDKNKIGAALDALEKLVLRGDKAGENKAFSILSSEIKKIRHFEPAVKNGAQNDARTPKTLGIIKLFKESLPETQEILKEDIAAAYNGDPAAKSPVEVIICYPGLYAIFCQRVAHWFYKNGFEILSRIMTEHAHRETGIDIHPGAKIGRGFFIDHGTGVVIGETAVIGNNVKIYQGVTIGARSFELDVNGFPVKGIKRHPNIGDNVIIYANATIIGNITIGKNNIITGNARIMRSIPAKPDRIAPVCKRV